MYAAFSLLLLVACLPSAWLYKRKALDDYVAEDDPHYKYKLLKTERRQNVTIYSLRMTSQKWLDESQVSRTIWHHQMYIVLPKVTTMKDSSLLIIDGGRNDHMSSRRRNISLAVDLAVSTRSTVAVLRQIPNQPITFHNDPSSKGQNSFENDIMASSWWAFMNNRNAPPRTLVEFAMVKAVVRGMDTTAAFLRRRSHRKLKITKFTLLGVNRRGWTTWLTAGVDNRVRSFVTVFSDFVGMNKALHQQFRSYGGWSFALKSLYNANITRQLDGPRFKELASHIDPLAYNARYHNKSKYIVKATGDELLQPDNTYGYWNKLRGEKRLWLIENSSQNSILLPGRLQDSFKAFYVATMQNRQMPRVTWERTETRTSGTIHFYTDREPSSISSYYATTAGSRRRDFRRFVAPSRTSGVVWHPRSVKKVENGVYKAEVAKPSKGWRGFFIRATFKGPWNTMYTFTSEVHIIPNTYPYADCHGAGCYGSLV